MNVLWCSLSVISMMPVIEETCVEVFQSCIIGMEEFAKGRIWERGWLTVYESLFTENSNYGIQKICAESVFIYMKNS